MLGVSKKKISTNLSLSSSHNKKLWNRLLTELSVTRSWNKRSIFFFSSFFFLGKKTVYKTEKDLFNETISFSYKCKSQPCVLIHSNYDAKWTPWRPTSQRLAMVGQTGEWSYSGDTDPFKALCVPEQPKLSKYLPVLPFLGIITLPYSQGCYLKHYKRACIPALSSCISNECTPRKQKQWRRKI